MSTATLKGWADTVDGYGKGAWIALMVVGFVVFWPIGLAVLAYLIWSGRMGCRGRRFRGHRWNGPRASVSSGNMAFDEYREETLRKLEDEQNEFASFLDHLRKAKDKAEFDQFMTDRANRPSAEATSATGNGNGSGEVGGASFVPRA